MLMKRFIPIRNQSEQGLTLVEVLAASGAVALVVLVALSVLQYQRRSTQQTRSLTDLQETVNNLALHLIRTGYAAGDETTPSCVTAASNHLVCNLLQQGTWLQVRFFHTGTVVKFQHWIGGAWVDKAEYPNITTFTVCGHTALVNSTCTVPTTALNNLYRLHIAPGVTTTQQQGYFRVQIDASVNKGQATVSGKAGRDDAYRVQLAVFSRNAFPLPNVSFLGGKRL